jgi:muconate cycloisomerase
MFQPSESAFSEMAPLEIVRIDAICVRLPLRIPMLMAGVELRNSDNLLVRIESTSGVVGWGEACAAPSHGGETLLAMVNSIDRYARPYLTGKNALALSAHTAALARARGKTSSAIAAVDLALHDLVGRHLGVPIHVLIGGLRRETIKPLWLIGTKSVEADLLEAEHRYAEGYRFFKLKLAVKSINEDLATLHELSRRYGKDVRLCADANGGYDFDLACAYVRAAAEHDLMFLEQPLKVSDVKGLQKLSAISTIPIGLDESVATASDLARCASAGINGIALKTLKLGGFSGVLAAAAVCEAFDVAVNLSGKIAESSIGSAALLQLGGALPNVEWGVSPSHLYLAEDVVAEPLRPTPQGYIVSRGAGLGIEVDDERVARFRISHDS